MNLDLIYGTPGERPADLKASLDAVLDAGVDHVSAYALIVEDGTGLARRIRRGDLPMTDDDVLASSYEMVDSVLSGAGFSWYEVSNWATSPEAQCQHNVLYWKGARLVGLRSGRPQPRRRRPLLEREAPGALLVAPGGRPLARGGS